MKQTTKTQKQNTEQTTQKQYGRKSQYKKALGQKT
jgi:hypothetical protein